jgi:filamentous hemagglutinin
MRILFSSVAKSHIAGANSVTIKSGGDTTLKGATVEGKQVSATVGGNLSVESLQDTRTYTETNKQVGGSVMVGVTQTGPVSGNVNLAKSNIDSNYASVKEQSAIKAGDGGFTVNVQGNTDLKGGAITSTQAAIDNNKNTFTTGGTLTTSDIQNNASYNANSVSVNVGMGSTPGQSASAGMSGVGFGTDKGSANSTTTAGISGIAGDSSKRTGDKEHGIAQIFNQTQVKAEIGAQTAITSEFGKNASKAVGDYAKTQYDKAVANNDQAGIDAWKEGGANRVALHTAVGALTGGTAGAVGAGSASAAAPSIDTLQTQLQQGLQKAGLGESTSKVIASLTAGTTAAGIGAAASGGSVAGGATAFNADMNNRQLSLPERQKLKSMANNDAQKEARLTDAACALAKCSAQYAPSTKEYQDAKASEMRGANNTAELTELAKVNQQTGLFGYGTLDGVKDSVKFTGNVLDKEVVQPAKDAATPDYVTIQGGGVGVGVNASVNLLNGDVFVGGAKTNIAPGASGSVVVGKIITDVPPTETRAKAVSEMLGGGSVQAGACVAGICGGVNQSMGAVGSNPPTAVEVGLGTPGLSVGTGASVNVRKNDKTSGK